MKHPYHLLFALLAITPDLIAQPCANSHVVVSPDGAMLYFSSDRGGNYDIYRSGLDGITGLERIVDLPVDAYSPSLSPDGGKVVFQAGDYGTAAEIWIANSDGTGLTQLTNNTRYDGRPNFSPDGSKIVFDGWDGSDYPEVFIMNVDGTGRIQLTDQPGAFWQSAPRFNPAGDKIYFLASFNADNHIVMMDPDGSNWVDITPPNNFGYAEANIAFSPDGQQIIFFTSENTGYANGGDLVIADADGSNWQFITASQGGEYFYQAVFHPTNGRLYYTRLGPGGTTANIWSMLLDGTDRQEVGNCSAVGIDGPEPPMTLSLAPNPAADHIIVSWQPSSADLREVVITDLMGRIVIHERVNGTDRVVLGTDALSEGQYMVQLRGTGRLVTEQVVIVR